MGNSASTASGQCLYHGFDSAPSRDQRPAYTQLLNAAAVASSSRRTFYTGRAVSLMNGLLASSSESAAAESKALESHTDGSSVSDDAALDSDEEAMPIPNGISPGTPLRHQSGVAPMMDSGRTTIPQVLKDQAREILRGDLSEGIMRLADRTSVKVFFSSNASDTEWERNALMMDVWPYLARFCKVLDLDFEIYDLRSGDKYSTPALPSVIPASEFTMMEDYLTKNNRSRDVRELLHVWFVRDDNAVPPVYNLRPISTIIPAFCSKAADPETQMEAFKSWEEIRYRLAALLRAGSRALGTEATSQNRFGRSLMEEELAVAYPHRTGTETERFYGFQRTLLDIKRKYVDNGPVASRYLDLINNQIDKDAVNQMAGLRNRIRANRFYAIPWRTDNFGLSPDSEKSHGTYLKSFCDDATRLLSEGILKHFTSRPFTRDWDPLAAEILRHHLAVREESKAFVGRSDELENIREFLDDSSGSVCVLYGPPGVGKTALISKTAEMVRESYPTSTLVIRLIGSSTESVDSRSLLRSICAQLARVYGYAAMRQRIEEASSNAANAGDGYADDTFDKLLGDLESWPPTSYEGLKAALPLVLSLATDAKPVVLIIDALDELSDSDDARDLDWLPSILPPNVKLLISSAPSSLYQPTLSALKSIFPESEDNRYVEVPVMSDADTDALVSKVQERSSRNLTDDQLSVFRSKCLASRMPLYIHSAWTLSASKWTSEGTNLGLAKKLLSAETLMGLVEDTLDRLESKLGRTFVSRALGYVTAARRGLSKSELEDVLSCDEDVLAELFFQMADPPVRRVPPIYLVRLREELGATIVERQVDGVNAWFWSHEQFRRFAEDRYLFRDRAIATHSALADYWEGKWARTPKPYIDSATGQTKSVLRYIMDQSLLVSGKPNTRRLASLVWHHLEAGVTGFQDAARTLQDLSHIGAALDAGLLWDLLASYRAALSRDSAEGLLLPQLVDYYRFLLTSAYIVASDPRQLIPVAVNLYQGSVVADDARKWIAANAPGLCWAEWANRPLARGEPIATLRGSDGGEPGEQFIITGRDTFGELVALVGLRIVDGARVASIYDTAEIKAAATGGGTARLLAKGVLPEDESGEDEGNPLVCAFSRSGNEIAIASRTILVVSTQNLSQCGMGTDPDLPEGDVITAISWTKDDGCIVTASDGAEPGRIALWDAVSFTLLRVIKAQYPRQPISSSFRTMGFWDEYRSLFILLDVDELAADAESGLFLQYIPSVPHSDPPPDGPSRFALAHRSPLVLIAADDGRGYILIDFKAKRPIARLPMDVDKVRQVVLSHDGQKVAIVPNDSKVISIFGLQARDNSSGQNDTTSFLLLGTVLGLDMTTYPDSTCSCLFSRSGNTVITDGAGFSARVWDMQELGDHSTLRFHSVLPNIQQGLAPIHSASLSHPTGWAITEGPLEVSLANASGRSRVRSYRVASGALRRRQRKRKDIILGIASHPTKPLMAAVTDSGNVTLIAADRMPDEPGTWVGSLWTSAFGKAKLEDDKVMTFNAREAGTQAGTTCITFLPSAGAPLTPQTTTAPTESLLFATGHEDGSVSVWEWNATIDPLDLSPAVTLRLNAGRITSLVASELVPPKSSNRYMAITVDDTAVLLWNGVNDDPESALVLVPPLDTTEEDQLSNISQSRVSVFAKQQGGEWNLNRPCAVAFSRTKELVLAAGSVAGTIAIWNIENKARVILMTPSSVEQKPAPIMAIAWAADDAALVSASEDKRISIHNTVTGDLVWVHSLWMVVPRLNVAAFTSGARQLAIVDHDGELTIIRLNGDWPSAVASAEGSKSASAKDLASSSNGPHPATRLLMAELFPRPHDSELVDLEEWDPSISVRLVRRRTEQNVRSCSIWEKSTGSGSHGHVALIRMTDGLPRGTYEVLCEVNIPAVPIPVEDKTPELSASPSRHPTYVPLKFVCGSEDELGREDPMLEEMEDPELQGLRGFTRLFPVEEQVSIAGTGMVTLHLGYVKAACKLNTCCIDLKRIPGTGEPFSFGKVHFIPVDPRLYRPEYEPPLHQVDAFTRLLASFEAFEESHRKRAESLSQNLPENMSALKAQHEDDDSASDNAADHRRTWVAGEDEASAAVEAKRKTRMSMFQPLSNVVGGILGAVGGLAVAEPAKPTKPPSFADIEREMELARVKARLEAKILEEEEDEKNAYEEAKERHRLAEEVTKARNLDRGPDDFDQDDEQGIDEEEHYYRLKEAEEALRRIELALENSAEAVATDVESELRETAVEPDIARLAAEPDVKELAIGQDVGELAAEADVGEAVEPDSIEVAVEPDAGKAGVERDVREVGIEPDTRKVVDLNASKVAVESIVGEAPALNGATVEIVDGEGV